MSVSSVPSVSLRQEQAESSRLAWAFIISLTIHLLIFGGYHTGKRLNWWQDLHWPAWLRPVKILAEALKKKPPPAVLREQEPPLMFVDVSEAQATPEPPKNAKFYSNKNSLAANPDPVKDVDIPRITGKQEEVVKAEDIPRERFVPLQPTLPQAPIAKEEQPEAKAKPAEAPGDLTMAKPEPTPKKEEGEAPQSKPRTIKEALARHPESRLPGPKLKQEGGVHRASVVPSFDTKATLYGEYDAALVEAISKRWYDLLDERQYASDSRGRVEIHFRLHSDGRISDLQVANNTAGEVLSLLCVKAIQDPAPFAAWPREMRMKLDDPRSIRFTFIYY